MIESGSDGLGWTGIPMTPGMVPPRTTGRFVVVFAEEEDDPGSVLGNIAGLSDIAYSRDFEVSAMDMAETESAEARVFSELGMAVVRLDPDQANALGNAEGARGHVVAVAPELVHHVLDGRDYLEGYRDGVTDVVARVAARDGDGGAMGHGPAGFRDTDQATWGLQVTRVLGARATGRDVRLAVLDTGMDLAHPDFVGRTMTSRSFIPGEDVQDGHGHGTHCVGTACGPRSPSGSRRYGVACDADIFVGKVLSNQGSGSDSGILAGINWAVSNDCAVISMSLGADVAEPHPPYVVAGRRSLRRGSLIIAAAGNNATRPRDPGFVGVPANSPDIMAVGAVDSGLDVASFSARSLPGRGGQVDIAGPGVAVYSSWPMPMRYRAISGTSMATPHVAGIAALLSQATGRRGLELWATLVKESQRLGLASADVGAGLVLAQA